MTQADVLQTGVGCIHTHWTALIQCVMQACARIPWSEGLKIEALFFQEDVNPLEFAVCSRACPGCDHNSLTLLQAVIWACSQDQGLLWSQV